MHFLLGPFGSLVGIAFVAISVVGCTCSPTRDSSGSAASSSSAEAAGPRSAEELPREVDLEIAAGSASHPVTVVLDPSGRLCEAAVLATEGRRHVVCDRTPEDLSAQALQRGLGRLKAQVGQAASATDLWLLSAPERAAVARSLANQDPVFFSRVAAWVGDSVATASLFGPTFLGTVGGRGFHSLVLLGPGARGAGGWQDLAARGKIELHILPEARVALDAGTWSTLERVFGASAIPAQVRSK